MSLGVKVCPRHSSSKANTYSSVLQYYPNIYVCRSQQTWTLGVFSNLWEKSWNWISTFPWVHKSLFAIVQPGSQLVPLTNEKAASAQPTGPSWPDWPQVMQPLRCWLHSRTIRLCLRFFISCPVCCLSSFCNKL